MTVVIVIPEKAGMNRPHVGDAFNLAPPFPERFKRRDENRDQKSNHSQGHEQFHNRESFASGKW